MQTRRIWTIEQFSQYTHNNRFSEETREVIWEALKTTALLRSFLEDPAGGVVLDSIVETIRENIMKIINLSVEDTTKNIDAITQAGLNIKFSRNFMIDFVNKFDRGRQHEEAMIIGNE
ncbi:MAG TPA: hypothetical protein ACFYD4_13610 [Candidatus Wunengus sp. YC61]|uniref:hypothetical protein n=1 Tax=Candidatus Wunengus sp. YC61 TaxID=3367698 RepID=UPI004026A37C